VSLALRFVAIALIVPAREAPAQARPRLMSKEAYQRLDSLEAVALTGTTFATRLDAVATITRIAGSQVARQGQCSEGRVPGAIEFPGLVSRLKGIYVRSQDTSLRRAIVDNMLWQAECTEAAAFLAEVAEEPPVKRTPPFGVVTDNVRGSVQWEAIGVLAGLGPSGESALRRLYGQGTVRDSSARALLEYLSQHKFRQPPPRANRGGSVEPSVGKKDQLAAEITDAGRASVRRTRTLDLP
jgi:hypothetical protein